MKLFFRRLFSMILMVVLLVADAPIACAAVAVEGMPENSYIEYNYSASVKCGTIRYISQNTGSKKFDSRYWSSEWIGEAYKECGTSSLSMALSYVGVNKTPKEILDKYSGRTIFGDLGEKEWGSAVRSRPKSIEDGMNRYLNGNGSYSPLIVHFKKEGTHEDGHYVCLIGKNSSGNYLVCDPANSNVWILKKSSGLYHEIDDYFQYYNKNAVIIKPYLEQCVSYTASGTVKIIKNTTVKSYPCSRETYKNSADVRTAKVNEKYNVIGLYKNTAGNYWYKISGKADANNQTISSVAGYIYAGNTEPIKNTWYGSFSLDGKTQSDNLGLLRSYFEEPDTRINIGPSNGVYTIAPKCAPNARLDAQNGDTVSGTNVQIYESNGTSAQRFRLTSNGYGYFTITCENSGLALDVYGGYDYSGCNVQLYTPNGTDAQLWKLVAAGNGYYYIASKVNSRMVLDVDNGQSRNGTNVQIWERVDGVPAQLWKLVK